MRRLLALGLFALFVPFAAWAQVPAATFTGTVFDDDTGEPLAGAHVFIASSMNGDITDEDGRFTLSGVPLGAHRLYASMVGFTPVPVDTLVRFPREYTVDFRMRPAAYELGEVVVEDKQDRRWQRRYERFVKLFIGETPNAMHTEITNPYVLDFENKGGEFVARASEPLIIENGALGYRIQYFLHEFAATPTRTRYNGEPLYEEMVPADAEEAKRWAENRRQAFIGSVRHFLLALLADKTEEQGFLVFSRPGSDGAGLASGAPGLGNALSGRQRFPLDAATLIRPGETPTEHILEFDNVVEVVFQGELEDESYLSWNQRVVRGRPKYQTSQLTQEQGPTIVDYKGDTLNPYGVTLYGYWAFERVADDVPKEYRPGR